LLKIQIIQSAVNKACVVNITCKTESLQKLTYNKDEQNVESGAGVGRNMVDTQRKYEEGSYTKRAQKEGSYT
jgi:hypothetical protein